MTEILLILAMPLASLIIEWGKARRIPAQVTLAFFSLAAGTCYVAWEMILDPSLKAWVIAAYPAFFFGTTAFYRFARTLTRMREDRLFDQSDGY